ncbi:outer membrane lipid asymmetry maintenance protein MlaD [Sedimentimonas flavescens]|uniref:Outer membrane lipid asymmetry maintenance protein MlaD n=1 Tax=Sedimentimonas flavescens TaxID=2851012 RepID=A0ABT2ZWI5_9RHOB|nr:outer membrane lipid asymmetry maintenance protein MlaD [Sedimentimonas flavescens]MBW0159100.1 outer membrane lipid asymmetry maintenance protein MlaD [Sedimentimonas flavescens]MCV2878108.1 outer membrane lipid asymmetry maintenance protein MlaD [Sedimentimonas flavescens]
MSENRVEVFAGAVVLAVAVGFMVWAGRDSGPSSGTYPLHASFRSVEGIVVGTDVRMAGVKVGSVTEIKLDPQTFFADTTLALRDDIQLPDDSAALVSSEGLMGGSFVELVPGGSLETLAEGDEILDTQGAVSVLALMMKFAGGSSQEGQ